MTTLHSRMYSCKTLNKNKRVAVGQVKTPCFKRICCKFTKITRDSRQRENKHTTNTF